MTFFYFRFSVSDHCLLSLLCLFFFFRLSLLSWSLLFAVSLESFFSALLGWCLPHFCTKCQLLISGLLFIVPWENLLAALIGWCIWHFRAKCQLLVVGLLFIVSWENLLAALIGWCIWHFWVKCQLDDQKRDWLCHWVANPWPRSYCFWVEWCGGIDVLQLLFLRYLQGCVNSCHHLLTLTGINCCVWIFSCFTPCCCRPFRYCLSLPVTKLEQFFCIIVFPLFLNFR